MIPQESETKIYFSKEYSAFRIVEGNRQLSEPRVRKIMADIESGIDVLKHFPILVKEAKDGRYDIYDGQHRFYISKKLERAVFFIIIPKAITLYDIALINSNTAKWNTKDYIHCYTQSENKNYKELDEFVEKYKISTTMAQRLLASGTPRGQMGSTAVEEFKRGMFVVEHLDKAVELCENCKLFSFFPYYKSTTFMTAIYSIQTSKLVTISDLAEKVEKNKEDLKKQDSLNEYIGNFETIWNKGKKANSPREQLVKA